MATAYTTLSLAPLMESKYQTHQDKIDELNERLDQLERARCEAPKKQLPGFFVDTPVTKPANYYDLSGNLKAESEMIDLGPRYVNIFKIKDDKGNYDRTAYINSIIEHIFRTLPKDITVDDVFMYCVNHQLRNKGTGIPDLSKLKIDYNEYLHYVKNISTSISKKEEEDFKLKLEQNIITNKASMVREIYGLQKFKLTDNELIELYEYLENINNYYK